MWWIGILNLRRIFNGIRTLRWQSLFKYEVPARKYWIRASRRRKIKFLEIEIGKFSQSFFFFSFYPNNFDFWNLMFDAGNGSSLAETRETMSYYGPGMHDSDVLFSLSSEISNSFSSRFSLSLISYIISSYRLRPKLIWRTFQPSKTRRRLGKAFFRTSLRTNCEFHLNYLISSCLKAGLWNSEEKEPRKSSMRYFEKYFIFFKFFKAVKFIAFFSHSTPWLCFFLFIKNLLLFF